MNTMSRQLKSFWHDLALLLDNGIGLRKSLEAIANGLEDDYLAKVIKSILRSMKKNKTFSEALEQFPELFSARQRAMVKTGEVGGMVEVTINKMMEPDFPSGTFDYKQFYWMFRHCMATGMPLPQIFRIIGDSFDNQMFKEKIWAMAEDYAKSTIAHAIAASGLFSKYEVEMINVGFETGCYDQILARLIEEV